MRSYAEVCRRLCTASIGLLLTSASLPALAPEQIHATATRSRVIRDASAFSVPVSFIENRGQFSPEVRFQVRAQDRVLWLKQDGIVFDALNADSIEHPNSSNPGIPKRALHSARRRVVFEEELVSGRATSID